MVSARKKIMLVLGMMGCVLSLHANATIIKFNTNTVSIDQVLLAFAYFFIILWFYFINHILVFYEYHSNF